MIVSCLQAKERRMQAASTIKWLLQLLRANLIQACLEPGQKLCALSRKPFCHNYQVSLLLLHFSTLFLLFEPLIQVGSRDFAPKDTVRPCPHLRTAICVCCLSILSLSRAAAAALNHPITCITVAQRPESMKADDFSQGLILTDMSFAKQLYCLQA